jgi:hypothetical protein
MTKQVIEMRQSLMGDLELCAARVGLRHEEGYQKIVSPQATFGTCQHAVIERRLKGEDIETVLFQGLAEFVEETIEAEYVRHNLDRAEESYEWVDLFVPEIIRATVEWQKIVADHNLQPKFIEKEFSSTIYKGKGQSYDIVLRGIPDLVEEDGKLWDWKTSGYGWKEGKAEAAAQAALYRFMVDEAGHPHRQFNFLVYNRKENEWELYETYPSAEAISSALARAVEYGKMIRAGVYPATPIVYQFGKPKRGWYCSEKWCPAWHVCPYKDLDI